MAVEISDEQMIAEVVHKEVNGLINRDIKTLEETILPEAKLSHVTGMVQTRDEWLKQIKLGRMHYFSSNEKLFQVMVNGDHAEVISRNEIDARIFGFRNTWPLQTRTQLIKVNSQWKINGSQASLY